jgi:hypothetical protein
MPGLYLFGGEKGGVGKSLVCRSAIEYNLEKKRDFIVFETDRSNPDVKRIYGDATDCRLSIFSEGEKYEDTANAIFNAATEKAVLVNLPAQVMPPLRVFFDSNDLFRLGKELDVNFYVFFVSDGGYDSLNLLKKSLEYFTNNATHIVVKNLGKTEDWEAFQVDKDLQKLLKKYESKIIEFPKFIGSVVRNTVDKESLTFTKALEFNGFGAIEKQRIRKFMRETSEVFETVGVF